LTETELIEGLQNHNANAYGKLLDDFQQKVFATCITFVPNKEDAEDIAQDVFVEVFNSIHKFRGNSKLSTWIYKITTNKCLEFIRKRNTKAQKIVFTLSKVQGMSYQEISDITEKSISSVESLMFRAKKNLQRMLENFYKDQN